MWHVRRKRGAYRVLVGKLEGRRQIGRPRYKSEEYIKMDLKGICFGGVD
jgi:hypothetical protein